MEQDRTQQAKERKLQNIELIFLFNRDGIPPGILWKIGTKITLARSNDKISSREASPSFNCITM